MADLQDVSIVRTSPPAAGHVLLELAPGPLAGAHERAGQYLMFQGPGDEKPRPMALATAPGRDPCQILVRADGDWADALLALKEGDTVQCSPPAGPGFPVADAAGAPLLLVATGSALGPIRAALQAALELRERPSSIRLLYGVRHEDEACFPEEREAWTADGVEVQLVVSQPRGDVEHRGHVQAFVGDVPADTLAFVTGQPAMMDEVGELLVAAGVPRERVKRNF